MVGYQNYYYFCEVTDQNIHALVDRYFIKQALTFSFKRKSRTVKTKKVKSNKDLTAILNRVAVAVSSCFCFKKRMLVNLMTLV